LSRNTRKQWPLKYYLYLPPTTWFLHFLYPSVELTSWNLISTCWNSLLLLFFIMIMFWSLSLQFSNSLNNYILGEFLLGNAHKLIEGKSEVDLSICEGVLGLSDVLGDLFFWLENGLWKCFDCIEELCKCVHTWSSWWSVQLSICSLSVAKLIIYKIYKHLKSFPNEVITKKIS